MSKKEEFFLEESVLDDMSQSFNSLEVPLSKKAFNFITAIALIIAFVVFLRISYLDLKDGKFYQARALANMSDITVIPAQRGLIFDRSGNSLVSNVPSFKAVLNVADFFQKSDIEKKNELKKLEDILNLPENQIQEWLSAINLEKQNSVILARNLTIEQVAEIKNLNYKDVTVENDYNRNYTYTDAFSHVLGYTGIVSENDLKNNNNLELNDIVGKAGIESEYDQQLRGKNGAIYDYRNAKNQSIGENSTVEPENGDNLYLSIDKDFQNYFYQSMEAQLAKLGRTSGAALAMNPQTGEILALMSFPSFNPNNITTADLTSQAKPLFDRAVSGVYSPGSTIKPLVATAALTENIISPSDQIFSPGYLDVPNPYNPNKPTRFLDWQYQGWVNLYSALAKSSDVYFYEVGGGYENQKGLGIDKLNDYWKKFGLDQKTGIDLPGEKTGLLPNPQEKETRVGQPWHLGDTYNVSIGQGDLMVTPIELLDYISAIANGGKIYQPYIVSKITDSKGDIVSETKPKLAADLTYMSGAIAEVQKGMIEGTQESYGTSYMLKDLPFLVGAKTGSAQVALNTKENAFFVGYGPADSSSSPQIVILILIENSKQGSLNAVPVANDVLKWYYNNRLSKKTN